MRIPRSACCERTVFAGCCAASLAAWKTCRKPPLTVWYNTRCPVCDAGISRQKQRLIDAVKAGRIEFRDINLEPEALAWHGASLEDIRRRLHATDADGRLLVGADVAIAVWRATPGEAWLATLFGNRRDIAADALRL